MNVNTENKKYDILSFDGGGILGIVPLIILQKIEKECPGHLNKYNFYSGTSTGSLIATMLALDIPLEDILKMYKTEGVDIFNRNFIKKILSVGGLVGSKYSNKVLLKILKRVCGDKTLSQINKKLLIPSFLLDDKDDEYRSWSPKIYDNFDDKYNDMKLYDICAMSSAAPTFFDIYKGHIDGGVIANDPSVCAITQVGSENINSCLSLGTGIKPKYITKMFDGGIMFWAKDLASIFMEGNSELTQYHAKSILGDRYLRINPVFNTNYPLDAIDKIPDIIKETEEYILSEKQLDFLSKN